MLSVKIINELQEERTRQIGKGYTDSHADNLKSIDNWCDTIIAYATWAKQMAKMGGRTKYRNRMKQIATMAATACDSYDRTTREIERDTGRESDADAQANSQEPSLCQEQAPGRTKREAMTLGKYERRILIRPSLLDPVHQGHKMIVIKGPRGSGKMTLAKELAKELAKGHGDTYIIANAGCSDIRYNLLRKAYDEIINTVSIKYPGETKYETVLKYIRNAENRGVVGTRNTNPDITK